MYHYVSSLFWRSSKITEAPEMPSEFEIQQNLSIYNLDAVNLNSTNLKDRLSRHTYSIYYESKTISNQ